MSELFVVRSMLPNDINWAAGVIYHTPELRLDPANPGLPFEEEVDTLDSLISDYQDSSVCLVAEFMGSQVGLSVALRENDEDAEPAACLSELIVEPSLRRLHIGTAMLVETASRLRELKYEVCISNVFNHNNTGREFLRRNSFKIGPDLQNLSFAIAGVDLRRI